jgi:hypothetical protein
MNHSEYVSCPSCEGDNVNEVVEGEESDTTTLATWR